MKRYVLLTLKVLLITLLILSAARLASLGAGLFRDRENLKQLQEWKGNTQPVFSDIPRLDMGYSAAANGVIPMDSSTVAAGRAGDPATKASGTASAGLRESEEACSNVEILTVTPINARRFAGLSGRNSDFAGWLAIEGTVIDYPVMYSPEDPDFYLHHDFDKKESSSGVPYIGKDCGPDSMSVILYAHNMRNRTMFAELLNYEKENFFKKHPVIVFDTTEANGTYDIIAVFKERVHYADEKDVFRYYNYGGDLTEEQFAEYVSKVKERSLYDTGNTAVYGQQLLTLSTCSYHTENGRFVVVAAKRCVKTGM